MNELVKVEPNADVRAYRASTEAADICKDIVVATSVTIQRRQYVPVEGWQAIALAHGCAAASRDVERVDGGVRAVGEVRRMSDGQLISTAEGFVGEDEAVWFGGEMGGKSYPPRAQYAIRAMAQTRAISRACRSAFAHVVVMMNKGLATTPAEEVYDAETGEVLQRIGDPKIPGISKIKERLNKFMLAGDACTDLEAFRELKRQNKDDLKKIRDGNHSYWTGDGADFEGFGAWIDRRQAELSAPAETLGFQMLCSAVETAKCGDDLRSLLDEHADAIAELDGEESRRFEADFNARMDALKNPTPITAGAYGG